jgi:hypothetical protein
MGASDTNHPKRARAAKNSTETFDKRGLMGLLDT